MSAGEGILRRLSNGVSRWRHRSGFGVHSPFAFRVVNEMIRSSYPYYATSKLRLLLRQENLRGMEGEYRLIFRIMARTGTRHALIAADAPNALERALRMACGNCVVYRGSSGHCDSPLFVYDADASIADSDIMEALRRDGSCALLRGCTPERMAMLARFHQDGLLLRNRRSILIFRRASMAPISYEMRF